MGKKWEEGDFPINKQDVEETLSKIAWERYLNQIAQNLNFKKLG